MFLQNLFASMKARRHRSARRRLQKPGPQLPKRWQDLLDVAQQKQIETHTRPAPELQESHHLHDKTGT
jgi:hypothetical protein